MVRDLLAIRQLKNIKLAKHLTKGNILKRELDGEIIDAGGQIGSLQTHALHPFTDNPFERLTQQTITMTHKKHQDHLMQTVAVLLWAKVLAFSFLNVTTTQ